MVRADSIRREDGVTLIELMVAISILGIVMVGVIASMTTALQLTNSNGNRTVAANLANAEIEAVKALPFTGAEGLVGATDIPITIEDVDYVVRREVYWAAASSIPGACADALGADTDVLRVDVSVTWPRMLGVEPPEIQTTLSPPIGLYDPNRGVLAVYVADTQNPRNPIGAVQVTITGPSGTVVETTSAEGCAVFTNLLPGTYDISATKANHVGLQQDNPVLDSTGVLAGNRTSIELAIAPAQDLDITIAGANGGTLPDTPLDVAVENFSQEVFHFPISGGTDTLQLFPTTYETWVGRCIDNDPQGESGGSRVWANADRVGAFDLSTGPATTTAQIATLDVFFTGVTAPTVPITLTASRTCTEAETGNPITQTLTWTGSFDTADSPRLALPYGRNWQISASGSGLTGAALAPDLGPAPDNTSYSPTPPSVTINLTGTVCAPVTPQLIGTFERDEIYIGSTWYDLDYPSGAATGDMAVLTMVGYGSKDWQIRRTASTAYSGTGWTLVEETRETAWGGRGPVYVSTFVRTVTPQDLSDGDFVVRTNDGDWDGSAHLLVFRGLEQVSGTYAPIARSENAVDNASPVTFASLTADRAQSLLIWVGGVDAGHTLTSTGQDGQVGPTLQTSGADTAHATFWQVVGSGATGTRSIAASGNDDLSGHMLLFRSTCS